MENVEKLKGLNEDTGSKDQKNNDSEMIDIMDVLVAAAEFLDDPDNEDKFNAFDDIKRKTVVRSFMPLRRKSAVVNKIWKEIQNRDSDIYDFGSAIEISLTFDALLAYTNINPDINQVIKDFDFYDILWASGYCDMILEYCEHDYHRIYAMIDRLIANQNIGELLDVLDNIKYDKIEDLSRTINRFKLNVDPKVIHDLAKIVGSQDAAVKELNEAIDSAAMDVVKAIEKRETGEG